MPPEIENNKIIWVDLIWQVKVFYYFKFLFTISILKKANLAILIDQLACFRQTKGRTTYFRPDTIVASFLHLT